MNNDYLDIIEKNSVSEKTAVCLIGFAASLFACQNANAQMVNAGDVKIDPNTIMAVYMDYENTPSGNFINDGKLYIFQNWKNDGVVSYTENQNGSTYFNGTEDQFIEGTQVSNLKNAFFENSSSPVPFHLSGKIAVGGNSEFKQGVVLAGDYGGKVIFREKAGHTLTSDLSFVDGQVEKDGNAAFEFPVGAGNYFRPSYHAAGTNNGDIYTTQYFNKNSHYIHSHDSRDVKIITINNNEYWEVTQDRGAEKIILSLTMDSRTTPSEFFNPGDDYQVVITRWDAVSGQWINEKGEVSDPLPGKPYEKLLTAQVSGYGLFTMALVKKTDDVKDLIIYNAVSPNDDGLNDSFVIKGIDQFPDNQVEIYNRWGVKVYDAKSYNESDNMFRGYSDGRATIKRGDKLPTGTYFYIVKYNTGTEVKERTGYLYINNQ
ncbi:gliding motility-associated C-terminal domain-containing protein [Flavobacterium ginsenosidimutans]|uniref:gliding motility-associated C-terminal domain-containing protein n=1 Tax=Flavobacterium ginsenosidimutans TaxID=687844 RepID=UPI000DACFC8C|nr:gliding motility-associated C-terminal domain-containing protein [Flavobacterium ginsenosidimutans]KAF2327747.1 gliding motility-associated C-terminal domain-containing protein [Flavobacterium ginsenosidimutans]